MALELHCIIPLYRMVSKIIVLMIVTVNRLALFCVFCSRYSNSQFNNVRSFTQVFSALHVGIIESCNAFWESVVSTFEMIDPLTYK